MNKFALFALVLGMGYVVAQEPAQKDQPVEKKPVEKGEKGRPFGGRGPFGDKGKGPVTQSWKSMVEKYDKNKDGALSKDEVEGKMWDRLGKEDADKDGKVTEKEHGDFRKSMMDKVLGKRRGEEKKKD